MFFFIVHFCGKSVCFSGVCVCVCERESVCEVCVCVFVSLCTFVERAFVSLRCVCVCERESVCVCVCVLKQGAVTDLLKMKTY